MAVQPSLSDNPFWKKKIRRACEAYDTDGSGFINRADFDGVVSRYSLLSTGASPEHSEHIKKAFASMCDGIGLKDETSKLNYAEFLEKFLVGMPTEELPRMIWQNMFEILDVKKSGVISYEEWYSHYKALGIDVAYAKASFDAINPNKDGKISKDEFIAYHREFFLTAEDKLHSSILFGPLD